MSLQGILPPSMRDGDDRPPRLLHLRSSHWFILTVVTFAIFTDVFLYGVIVPVLPFALAKRVNVQANDIQHWISILLAVFSVGILVGSPILGWLADKSKTRRLPMVGGLVILIGATIMLCIGNSISLFIAGRFIQGLSAAVTWTTGLALLVDTVGPKDIGQTMGYVSLGYSIGILIGPLIGGVVYAKSGYYAVFYVAFSFIAVDVVLRLSFIEKKVAAKWLGREHTALTSMEIEMQRPENISRLGERNLVPAVDDTPQQEALPDEPRDSSSATQSKRIPAILTLVKSKRIIAAFWGVLVVAAAMTAFDSTLPLFANRIFGFNSLGSGLLFLALLLPSLTGPIVGRLCDRYGPRWLAVAGFLVSLPFWVLLRLVTHKTVAQIVLLCVLLTLIGFCVSLVVPPLMAEFSYVVGAKERQTPGLFGESGAYAQSYGLFNTAWAAGSMVGPLWAGFVEGKAGWATMTWTMGLLSGVSALPILIYTGGLISRKHSFL